MRVLVLTDLFPPIAFGGYETECASVVDHLAKSHEVVVLTSSRSAAEAPEDPRVLRALPYSGAGAQLEAPRHALAAARVAGGVLSGFKPDLVFVWNPTAIPTAAIGVAVRRKVPIAHRLCERFVAQEGVFADHFVRYLAGPQPALRLPWAWSLRAVNRLPGLRLDARTRYPAAVSWNSEALRTRIGVSAGVRPVLDRVIHPATRHNAELAGLPRRPASRPTIVFVGRLSRQKGADVAVEALAELGRRHGVHADLEMVGPADAKARQAVLAQAERCGVGARVRLLGQLDTPGLAGALSRAHVLVAPSREEAFGLACVEAAIAGVPVVASRVDGIPEALREDVHALFHRVGDAADCADALARTLRDRAATAARAERALDRARELSLDRYLAATDAFVDDAMAALTPAGS